MGHDGVPWITFVNSLPPFWDSLSYSGWTIPETWTLKDGHEKDQSFVEKKKCYINDDLRDGNLTKRKSTLECHTWCK